MVVCLTLESPSQPLSGSTRNAHPLLSGSEAEALRDDLILSQTGHKNLGVLTGWPR